MDCTGGTLGANDAEWGKLDESVGLSAGDGSEKQGETEEEPDVVTR